MHSRTTDEGHVDCDEQSDWGVGVSRHLATVFRGRRAAIEFNEVRGDLGAQEVHDWVAGGRGGLYLCLTTVGQVFNFSAVKGSRFSHLGLLFMLGHLVVASGLVHREAFLWHRIAMAAVQGVVAPVVRTEAWGQEL